jgi:hypothetical protein
MALDWSVVEADHVRNACSQVAASGSRQRVKGIVVWCNDQALSAKEVLRVAYRLANNLSQDAEVKFASGEATLNLLKRLGFQAERLQDSKATSAE